MLQTANKKQEATFVKRPFFQDNLGKPAPEKQKHYGKTNLGLLEQEIVSGSGII